VPDDVCDGSVFSLRKPDLIRDFTVEHSADCWAQIEGIRAEPGLCDASADHCFSATDFRVFAREGVVRGLQHTERKNSCMDGCHPAVSPAPDSGCRRRGWRQTSTRPYREFFSSNDELPSQRIYGVADGVRGRWKFTLCFPADMGDDTDVAHLGSSSR